MTWFCSLEENSVLQSCISHVLHAFLHWCSLFFLQPYDNECGNNQGKTDAFTIDLCLYFCIQWWITWSCHVQALRCFRKAFPNHATHLDYPLIERALFTNYPINTEHFILCFSGFFFHIMRSSRILFLSLSESCAPSTLLLVRLAIGFKICVPLSFLYLTLSVLCLILLALCSYILSTCSGEDSA